MRKFMLVVSVLIVALMASFVSPISVGAETQEEVFNNAYNYFHSNPLEEIDESQIEEYGLKIESAIELAESLKNNDEVNGKIVDFEEKCAFILKKYKFFVIGYELDKLYNVEDYSNTENGVKLLNEEISIVKYTIESAVNKKQVDDAYDAFKEFINSGVLAKNVNYVKTNEDSAITGEFTTLNGSLYFSTDDYLIIEECKNSALRKNTNDALLENDKLLMTDGGVAYYFNVKLNQNGVIVESILEKVKVTINLKDVGLEVENGAVAQIAKYNGNKSVTLTPATILNDCVTFEISELGQYALCLEGYATQNESRLATFFTKYKGYMLLALIGIFLIVAPIQYNRKMKRRKLKQEKLAYGRYRKEERKKKRKTNHIKK